MTSMQRQTAAPRGGPRDSGPARVDQQAWGGSLSPLRSTAGSSAGSLPPSLARSRTRGVSHLWSANDAVLVTWLARLRADGLDVFAFRRPLKGPGWSKLGGALTKDPPLFLTITSGGTAAVLRAEDLLAYLRAPSRSVLVVWPALPLAQRRYRQS